MRRFYTSNDYSEITLLYYNLCVCVHTHVIIEYLCAVLANLVPGVLQSLPEVVVCCIGGWEKPAGGWLDEIGWGGGGGGRRGVGGGRGGER